MMSQNLKLALNTFSIASKNSTFLLGGPFLLKGIARRDSGANTDQVKTTMG